MRLKNRATAFARPLAARLGLIKALHREIESFCVARGRSRAWAHGQTAKPGDQRQTRESTTEIRFQLGSASRSQWPTLTASSPALACASRRPT